MTLAGTAGTKVLDGRISRMRTSYESRVADLRVDLAAAGLRLEITANDQNKVAETGKIVPGAEYPFEDVKALDLHNMRYDFSSDVQVGANARKTFVQSARSRKRHLNKAAAYLRATGQLELLEDLPSTDVSNMNVMADTLSKQGRKAMLPSAVASLQREREILRRSRTVTLDQGLAQKVLMQVDAATLSSSVEIDDLGLADSLADFTPHTPTFGERRGDGLE